MSSALAASSVASSPRVRSIDVFRGATIAAMVLVNAQFSHEVSYRQLAHAAWHGWTFADTIFPCFLFIVGVSLVLSSASRMARGECRGQLLAHAVQRSLLIFACGVAIDTLRIPAREFPFVSFEAHLQLTGVLQKIAICYLAAFLIYLWTGTRGAVVGIIGLNLLYLGLLYYFTVPGCGPGSLAATCNFPRHLDEVVLGGFRSNSATFDPDGVGSILPAITSVLFGVLAGKLLLQRERSPQQRLLQLLAGGLILIAAGESLSTWVPINKQLWTTSFALLMAGLAATGLACTVWLLEGRPQGAWFRPLEVLGVNAIAAYLISRLVMDLPRVHVMGVSLYNDVLVRNASPPNASLLYAMVVLAAVYAAVWIMDRRDWHLKL
jgi:predicted acyltransferase